MESMDNKKRGTSVQHLQDRDSNLDYGSNEKETSPLLAKVTENIRAVSEKNQLKRSQHPTNDLDTFVHLVKCNIGTGLLALPAAVKNAGYIVGPVGILVLGLIATHSMALLLDASTVLRKKYKVVALDYSETMMLAWLDNGQAHVSKIMRHVVNIFLILTQFGFCAVYLVFIAENIQQVFEVAYDLHWSKLAWIAMLAVPVILFSWIQNLDHLSPLSAVANLCLLTGIVVILYDEVDQMVTCKAAFQHNTTLCAPSHSPAQPRDPLFSLLSPAEFGLPLALFFGSVAFTYEAIGIVLPLENKMRKPSHAKPVVYFGMILITVMYAVFGAAGYFVYGERVQGTVTLNLCGTTTATSIVFLVTKLLFALDIFVTYLLQFYVPLDFLEPLILKVLPSNRITYWSKMAVILPSRTVIVLLTVTLALTVPDLGDLLSLVGALASSMLAFVFPPLLEILAFWSSKHSRMWLLVLPWPVWLVKDCLIIILGLIGFGFGTFANIQGIVNYYSANSTNATSIC